MSPSLSCLHTLSMEADEGSDQNLDLLPHWIALMHVQRVTSGICNKLNAFMHLTLLLKPQKCE